MKKKLVIIMIVLTAVSITQAQNSRIFLKNGSEFTGYLAKQIPGKTIVIHATEAVINVDNSLVTMKDKSYNIKELPKEWQSWAYNNSAVSNDVVKLTLLSYKDKKPSIVKILERGSWIKYYTCTKQDYQFLWSDLDFLQNDKRDKDLLSAINDSIVLKTGESYKGQILENRPGKSIKVYNDNTNVTEVLSPADIKSIFKKANNKNIPIWEQAYMIDKVLLKDSTAIIGIIIEQVFGEKVVIQLKDKSKREISSNSIVEFEKLPNMDYVECIDIHIGEKELRLKEGDTTLALKPIQIKRNDNEGVMYLTNDKDISATITDSNVVIYAKFGINNPVISIFKTKTYNQRDRNFETFTYKDIATPSIIHKISDSPYDETIKIEFAAKEKGYYVIYIKDIDKYFVLKK